MKAVKLGGTRIKDFVDYYKKYSKEQDESYTASDDYEVSENEPAYLLLDKKEKVIGAAALMLHLEFVKAKCGRFRIFHSTIKTAEAYGTLLDAVLKNINGIENVYCFIEDFRLDVITIWESLGFRFKRNSWILTRELDVIPEVTFEDGYELRKFIDGEDEESYCSIINDAFQNIMGHVDMLPSRLEAWKKEESYIPGGTMLLWHKGKAIGLLRLAKETEEGDQFIFIETIALMSSYQGKGLGRNLLRSSIKLAKKFGYNKTMLSVNAENDKAVELYLKEGFVKTAVHVCYNLKLD